MGLLKSLFGGGRKKAATSAAGRNPRYVRILYRDLGETRPINLLGRKLYTFRWPFPTPPVWGGWGQVPGMEGRSTGVLIEPGQRTDWDGEIVPVAAQLPGVIEIPRDPSGAPIRDLTAYNLPPAATNLRPYEPWGAPSATCEIEFEHLHRQEIHAIFTTRKGRVTSPETITNEPALLVPSAGSPYPAVVIDGLWLGNAIDDRLLQLAPALQKLKQQGLALQVPARLWGFLDGADFRSRVTIGLPTPTGIHPPGPLPDEPRLLLPRGGNIQVTGEGKHLSEVAALLDGGSERPVVAELYRLEVTKARSIKTVVGVRIYGEEVGQLTPVSSEHFLPLLEACIEEGVTACCRATVKGNQLKADVVLHAAKAGDLSDTWLHAHLYAPAQRRLLRGAKNPAAGLGDMWDES